MRVLRLLCSLSIRLVCRVVQWFHRDVVLLFSCVCQCCMNPSVVVGVSDGLAGRDGRCVGYVDWYERVCRGEAVGVP